MWDQEVLDSRDDYCSGIALAACRKALSLANTRRLFIGLTSEKCGLFGCWQVARDRMIAHLDQIRIDIATPIRRWGLYGAFMYSNKHPKIRVLFDITKQLVRRTGREFQESSTMPHDNLAFAGGFAIGESPDVPGADLFKTFDTYRQFGLEEFLAGSFAICERYPPEQLVMTSEFQRTFDLIEVAT